MSHQPRKKSQTEQRFATKTLRMMLLYPLFIFVVAITLWFGIGLISAFLDGTFVGIIGTIASVGVFMGLLFFLWVLRLSLHEEELEWSQIFTRLRGLRQENERIQSILQQQSDETVNPRLLDDNSAVELEKHYHDSETQQMRQS